MKFKCISLFAVIALIFASCSSEPVGIFEGEVIRQWTIPFSALNINPAPAGRTESGTLTLQLLSDNSIRYDFTVDNLNNDALASAQIRSGDPLTNGPVVLDLTPRIASPVASGIVQNVRQSLLDSLVNENNDLYIEIQSSNLPNGLARQQINNPVTLAADVTLTGGNEVPPVTTTARGVANIRLTANRKLYSRVTVTNLEVNDALTMAHIHRGAPGVNGPILVDLALSAADFNVKKVRTLDSTSNALLVNEPRLYVNAHSVLNPAGKIRGQLR